LAQLELVDALIRTDGPGFRQARGHQIAGHGLDERIVERVEHPEWCDDAYLLTRVEPEGRERHVQRPAHLAFRLGLRRRGLHATGPEQGADQHTRERRASAALHGLLPGSFLSHTAIAYSRSASSDREPRAGQGAGGASAMRRGMTSAVNRAIDAAASASLMLPNASRQTK